MNQYEEGSAYHNYDVYHNRAMLEAVNEISANIILLTEALQNIALAKDNSIKQKEVDFVNTTDEEFYS